MQKYRGQEQKLIDSLKKKYPETLGGLGAAMGAPQAPAFGASFAPSQFGSSPGLQPFSSPAAPVFGSAAPAMGSVAPAMGSGFAVAGGGGGFGGAAAGSAGGFAGMGGGGFGAAPPAPPAFGAPASSSFTQMR